MAVTRFLGSRDRAGPGGLPQEGEIMAKVMLAEVTPVQADLGMIVARSAERYGPSGPGRGRANPHVPGAV